MLMAGGRQRPRGRGSCNQLGLAGLRPLFRGAANISTVTSGALASVVLHENRPTQPRLAPFEGIE